MRIELSERKILVFLITVLVFLDMKPYFVWKQISPLGYRMYTMLILVTTFMMTYGVCKKKLLIGGTPLITDCNMISLPLFFISMGFVALFLYQAFFSGVVGGTNQPFNLAMLCVHIGLMMFCLQDNVMLQRVFRYTKRIFVITLIPSIIIYAFNLFGISLPHVELRADGGKTLTGQSYDLYLGVATVIRESGVLLNRICGIYQEPGFVGTVGALFLIGDRLQLKNRDNTVIIVALLLTYSVAAIVMLVIAWLIKHLVRMRKPEHAIRSFCAILGIIIVYFIFMNIPFARSSMLGQVQARLIITEAGLSGDNRMKEFAEVAYNNFMQSGWRTVLLGYGADSANVPGTDYSIWQNVSSYKEFIFYYGVMGFGILLASLIFSVLQKYKNVKGDHKWDIVILLTTFMISIYQRPNVNTFYFLCLLFGGCSNIAMLSYEETRIKSCKGSI